MRSQVSRSCIPNQPAHIPSEARIDAINLLSAISAALLASPRLLTDEESTARSTTALVQQFASGPAAIAFSICAVPLQQSWQDQEQLRANHDLTDKSLDALVALAHAAPEALLQGLRAGGDPDGLPHLRLLASMRPADGMGKFPRRTAGELLSLLPTGGAGGSGAGSSGSRGNKQGKSLKKAASAAAAEEDAEALAARVAQANAIAAALLAEVAAEAAAEAKKGGKKGKEKKKAPPSCARCGELPPEDAPESFFMVCGGCRAVRYCGEACRDAAWEAGHKAECVGAAAGGGSSKPAIKQQSKKKN